MELENILSRMENYLMIAQKCKNGSDKIEFYKNHFDAFSLGESDAGELGCGRGRGGLPVGGMAHRAEGGPHAHPAA